MDDCPREDCCEAKLPGHLPPFLRFLDEPAKRLGFAAVGAAAAGEVPRAASKRYDEWISAGRHGGLAYAERHYAQRLDPRRKEIVEDATAVLSVALPYGRGATHEGLFRFVAAHARGRDYHDTMREKLTALASEISIRFPGSRQRIFTDTAPILERTWAVAAGLGSTGANGALFVPGVGPRVVLGEIVCAKMPRPEPLDEIVDESPCRECGACLRACPTGALVSPGVVDARRCLSFHTIENARSEIPPEVARHMELVFGCDACTSACPRAERLDPLSRLDPPPHACPEGVDLAALSAMEEHALAHLLEGTCIARTGAAAIRRNARLVLEAQRAVP